MKRSEDELWNSSFGHVVAMIDMYLDEKQMQAAAMNNEYYDSKYFMQKQEAKEIHSLKEMEGW
jgi:hypothetical protein